MVKVRIHEIAKELGIKSKDVINKAKEINFPNLSANSTISSEQAQALMNYIMKGEKPNIEIKEVEKENENSKIEINKRDTSNREEEGKKKIEKNSKIEEKENISNKKQKEDKKREKEVKKEINKKKSNKKENLKKESLSQGATLKNRRRGLIIVKKKKKPEDEVSKNKISKDETKETLFDKFNDISSEVVTKKKKKAKKSPAVKQESKKIDIEIGGNNFLDISLDHEIEENYMPDITIYDKKEETKKSKKVDTANIRSTKKSSFLENKSIQRKKQKKVKKKVKEEEKVDSIEIPEEIRVYEFAEKIKKSVSEVISALFKFGLMRTRNDFLDKDDIEILAEEFEVEVKTINVLGALDKLDEIHQEEALKSDEKDMQTRPPVITIMGHVDHGKTSLLDRIRKSKVASGEKGGITQHIGAYMINKDGKNITFLDTPGHAAFTQMRARGASVTDIVIIVVAADDGVKKQTKEAIDHAKAAKVPIIVAINKIDKPTANPDLVKQQLAELELLPIEWGGDTEYVEVSAKTGQGIDDLLELILLQAEVLDLKANPSLKQAKAIVIESGVETGRGPVATVIVENGTLRVGDNIVCGIAYGRIRALLDEKGKNLTAIHPGEPGVVVGLSEVPHMGEKLFKIKDAKEARELAMQKIEHLRQKELSESKKVTLEELNDKIAEGKLKSLPVIIKADVGGTLEAIKTRLLELKNDEVKVDIIGSGVGGITEGDLALAQASENCIILGFHIRPTGVIKKKAKDLGIEIETYNTIYALEDDVKNLLGGLLSPIEREEALGQAEVREVFRVPKVGAIAGCIVTDGTINRGVKVRVIRDGIIIYEGEISSLKRFKDDVNEVKRGFECGIAIEGYNDIKVGDFLESFKIIKERAKLE